MRIKEDATGIGFTGLLTLLILGLTGSGCGAKTSTAERAKFATLYAELLIAENTYRNDTARQKQVTDSLLQGTEFESREDIKAWIEELTVTDSKGLQEMLDSTQKYLERVRDDAQSSRTPAADTGRITP